MAKRRWQREVKYLYPFILKRKGYIVNIEKAIGYYDRYTEWVRGVYEDQDCPKSIKALVSVGDPIELKMPKYLQWAKEKLVKKK